MSFENVAAGDAPNDTVNTARNQRRGTFGQSELAQRLEQLSKTHSLRKLIDKRVQALREEQRRQHTKNMKAERLLIFSNDPRLLEFYIQGGYMQQKQDDIDIRDMLVHIKMEQELDEYILDEEERTNMVNELRSKVDKVRGNSCLCCL